MQQLHLVGFTTDHKGLILGTRRGTDQGGYVVTLDRAFVEQVEELLRLQAGEGGGSDASGAAANGAAIPLRRPKVESRLTPREVQSLLRTGRSVSEVAEAAGMSEDWVGRFAPPVLAEQARVIERATGLIYSKPRIGPSIQPLGESVIWNLAERGIVLSGAAAEDAWTAFQQAGGGWVVRVSYLAERRRQHADWTIDMAQGLLKAVNRLGNELAYVEAGRRRPTALPPATPVSASAQRAAAAPPKPPPPPVLPARPSGRLSLLGSGAGGLVRQSPPAAAVPRDRSAQPVSSSPPPAVKPDTPGTIPPSLPTTAPRERRARPLRPLSTDAPAPSESEGRPKAPAAVPPPEGASASVGAPLRRERPLRAPSRIRRDELAAPPPEVRRPAVPPRGKPGRAPDATASSLPDAMAHRFAPAHSPAERKVSTAERFGLSRSGGRIALGAEPEPVPVPRFAPVPVAERPEPEPLDEVERNQADRPDGGRAAHLSPDADEVYQRFADLGVDEPITAPVPALETPNQDDDFGHDFAPDFDTAGDPEPVAGDQVLIRAGQARALEQTPGKPSAKPRSPADDRARTGRLKLRRRPQDSP